jgi:hypothetical protein
MMMAAPCAPPENAAPGVTVSNLQLTMEATALPMHRKVEKPVM